MVRDDGLRGVEAVVDKDRTARLLASDLGTGTLVFLTDVEFAYVNYDTPDQRPLRRTSPEEVLAHLHADEFGRGSMHPKMEAAVRFVERGGARAVVTTPEHLVDALAGETGTQILACFGVRRGPRPGPTIASLTVALHQPSGMYDQILVPTDGSHGTRGAVEHAIDLATTYGATLHTIYVVDPNVGAEASVPGTLEALEATGETAIDEVIQQAEAAGVDSIEGAVAQGAPHRAILEYVDDRDVDLIVMGTHGRTGLDRYLLGSVTEKVVRLSDAPVLTVRMPASDDDEQS